jgi:hypothetical protein
LNFNDRAVGSAPLEHAQLLLFKPLIIELTPEPKCFDFLASATVTANRYFAPQAAAIAALAKLIF